MANAWAMSDGSTTGFPNLPKLIMPRLKLFNGVRLVLLLALLAGCEKKASDEIDFGTVTNSVYHNNYFSFNVPFPKDWSPQDQSEQQRLAKLGGKLISGDDKNLQAEMKMGELRTVNLFAVFEHPPGSPVDFNPSILSVAENVRHAPGIKRGSDYHFQAKKVLQSGQLDISFPKDIYTQKLGGVDFDVMEAHIRARGIVVKQKYYATIMKGYALCLVTSFVSDEQDAALQKVLSNVTFDKAPAAAQ
jgi:hypothetical protein